MERLTFQLQLLGPPRLTSAGAPVEPPRGTKSWGLLAYLVRAQVAPTRGHLASLLFSEADDPLGALRWTLSALRRHLGPDAELGDDPVRLRLPPGAVVDVDVLDRGTWRQATALPGFGQDLLAGLVFRSSPGFELWLEAERRHVDGTTSAVLHHAALALLAAGDARAATRHATELVCRSPYEENGHVLLVRCLRAAGDPDAARRHVDDAAELLRRALGTEPTAALRAAAAAPHPTPGRSVSGRSGVLVQLQAAEAALAAGATEAGVHGLWSAVADARRIEDHELVARSLVELGAALVHAGRGTDEEGAAVLHEGTALAESAGRPAIAARGWREIAWIHFLRAEYVQAEACLDRVESIGGSDEDLVWADVIRGTAHHDLGRHDSAGPLLQRALDRSERLGDGPLLVYALTHLGRFHLLREELDVATPLLDRALEECAARGLTALTPWPESFRGEVDLATGDVDGAAARFEHAHAMGCQVGDPCWESIGMRGLGLVADARGDRDDALELLSQAPAQCRRLPDTYRWIEVYALDALCSVAVAHGAEGAPAWVGQLESTAARRGLRELVVRALAHRARLGEPGALVAARSLAAQIGNPALQALLSSTPPTGQRVVAAPRRRHLTTTELA